MSGEGFSRGKWSGKWPRLVRTQNSKRREDFATGFVVLENGWLRKGSFSDSNSYKERKLPQSADAASRTKLFLLHDWWLVKADSDSGGKRLGIGGYTTREHQGIRCFSSAYISKRHDAVTLETVDGIKLLLQGYINRVRTLENGFSQEVCKDFQIGFPYYWEEFATLSVAEDSSASKGVPPSGAYTTPPRETRESKTSSEKSPVAKVAEAESSLKRKTRVPEHRADSGGPLTRSRARLLDAPRYLQID